MALTLQEAIARVPLWAGAGDLKVTPLTGGITNSNYRVERDGEAFVLRITGADTELLGIDREHEYAANLIAGKQGLAPEVVYFIRPEGYLVTRFISGRPVPPEEITRPENIQRVAEVVRRIHDMPEIPGQFSVFRAIEAYSAAAVRFRFGRAENGGAGPIRYQMPFPEEFDWLIDQMHKAETALQSHPITPCPCHNDLLNANFLTDGQLYVLDWEYAGMGDGFFDLANFSDHHDLSDDQDRWLLECYFGRMPPAAWAHLKIMKMLSDLREATWGLVQIGISKLDFDYREYADKFFGRVMQHIHHPQWGQWIKEVRQNV